MALRDSIPADSFPARNWRWPAALLALGVLAWALAGSDGVGAWLFARWREHHAELLALVQGHPLTAAAAVLLLHALLAMLAVPGSSILMLVAGAAYGPWAGTLLCLTGCTAGAGASMLAARHFLRPLARRKLGQRFDAIDARIAAAGAAYLFSLRVLPVVPFAITNVAAGLSTMNGWTFLWVSFLGMLASTFVYVNAGAEIAQVRSFLDLLSPGVLLSLLVVALLPWLFKAASRLWPRQPKAPA
ncbi:MAG: TVP38/TMEM64 family protein [Rhodocyclales bacterium]|nr:TVP38/TMEM64 family protein [Rhodocyclales bacterium]